MPTMGEWKMEEMPLPALFEQARKIHFLASESAVDQDTLRKGIETLKRCDEMVSTLGLFSSNETKDDVSTVNLKFLLVPFYLGELTEKIAGDDRTHALKFSQDQFKEFISSCEALDLVPEEEIEYSVKADTDFAARRAKKIARFKHQRAAESKLQELKERRERRGRSLKAAALSTPVEAGEEDLLDDDGGEDEREAWLTTISLALYKAFDMLEILKKEEELLSAVKEKQLQEGNKEFDRAVLDERARKAETWHQNASIQSQFSKPAQPITCATFAQDVMEGRAKASQAHEHKHQPLIFGPASLIGGKLNSERERMAAQVFQPGYRVFNPGLPWPVKPLKLEPALQAGSTNNKTRLSRSIRPDLKRHVELGVTHRPTHIEVQLDGLWLAFRASTSLLPRISISEIGRKDGNR